MRSQSTFEKMTEGTSQTVFAWCFIVLRIAVGLTVVYFASQIVELTSWSAGSPISILTMVLGGAFALGLLVRPIALLWMICLILLGLMPGSLNSGTAITSYALVTLGLSLFAAGGSGHVLGLDGIISRNIRRPNAITKFLFG